MSARPCVTVALVALSSFLVPLPSARAGVVADLRANFDSVSSATGDTTAVFGGGLGIPDTSGDGHWNYYQSNTLDPSAGTLSLLSWKATGNQNVFGFGGTAGYGMPVIANQQIWPDPTSCAPQAGELYWHPENNSALNAVARWSPGGSEVGDITVTGTFRHGASNTGSGIQFAIYVAGIQQYSLTLPGSDATTHSFNLADLPIALGQNVDFVVNANGDYYGDASLFSATILSTPAPITATWSQSTGGDWNTGVNWSPAKVPNAEDLAAVLGPSLIAAGTINISSSVTTGALRFDNANSYTLASGPGQSLTLQTSSGTASIADVSGSHLISASLTLASDTNISVGNAGDTLTISGPVSSTASQQLGKRGSGTLVLSGTNTYTGSTTINGGTLAVSGTLATSGVTVNTGTLAIGNDAALGTSTLTMAGGAIQAVGAARTLNNPIAATGSFAVSGEQDLTLSGDIAPTGAPVLSVLNAPAVLHLSGPATRTFDELWVGNNPAGSAGIGTAGNLEMPDGVLNVSQWLVVGRNSNTPLSTFNQSGGATTTPRVCIGSDNSPSAGVYNLSNSAALSVGNYLTIGRSGGGSTGVMTLANIATLSVTGGTFYVGESGTGTLTIADTATVNSSVPLVVGANAGSSGTINLNGGTLAVPALNAGTGTAAINFNGGTLQANASLAIGVAAATVHSGGAIFDTNGNDIVVGSALAAGSPSGGVTKKGLGTLTLAAQNTYSGGTTLNEGTLVALQPGALGTGPVILKGGVLRVGSVAPVSLTGFGDGSGWQLNNGAALDTGTGTLTITDATLMAARSAFHATKVPSGAFTASFVYQAQSVGHFTMADGATFVLQNQGITAVGYLGYGLGYGNEGNIASGIHPSAAVELNIYDGQVRGTRYAANGAVLGYLPTDPIDLASGHRIQVTLTYDGASLNEELKDLDNSDPGTNTWSHVYPANIPADASGGTAYVGFTGGTGGAGSLQTIREFTFTAPGSGSVYANNLRVVTSAAAILTVGARSTAPVITLGKLDMEAGSTLDVLPDEDTPAELAYGLTLGGLNGPDSAQILMSAAPGVMPTLTLGNHDQPGDFAGTITGASALVKTGLGIQVLGGLNDYTGGTTVARGTLQIGSAGALPAGRSLTVGTEGTVVLTSGLSAAGAVGQSAAPVPEPSTLALLAVVTLAGMVMWWRPRPKVS